MHELGSVAPEPYMLEFPKQQRLLRRLEFSQTMDEGTKVVMPHMVLIARRVDSSLARVGFIVSKKVGGAVERNSVKRRLRETYRLLQPRPLRIDLVIIARGRALDASFEELGASFREGLRRALAALERREKPRAAAQAESSGSQIPGSLVRERRPRPLDPTPAEPQ